MSFLNNSDTCHLCITCKFIFGIVDNCPKEHLFIKSTLVNCRRTDRHGEKQRGGQGEASWPSYVDERCNVTAAVWPYNTECSPELSTQILSSNCMSVVLGSGLLLIRIFGILLWSADIVFSVCALFIPRVRNRKGTLVKR